MPAEFVISFQSTHDVIKAKKELQRACIAHEIIPTPKKFSSECGMSVKVEAPVLDQAQEILRLKGVRYKSDLL
ncbi:MAG: hypothetical protein A4E53_04452 [Pelotomaculum sp. PtaB.Bin104]|nr:MAG: hypothetical protein A4E53_04452 [Pelotomaculum sp. PtaB.Bin104]